MISVTHIGILIVNGVGLLLPSLYKAKSKSKLNFTVRSSGQSGSAVFLSGRMPDSQSSEPGFDSPMLMFRGLGIFVLSIDAPADSAV